MYFKKIWKYIYKTIKIKKYEKIALKLNIAIIIVFLFKSKLHANKYYMSFYVVNRNKIKKNNFKKKEKRSQCLKIKETIWVYKRRARK